MQATLLFGPGTLLLSVHSKITGLFGNFFEMANLLGDFVEILVSFLVILG